MLTFVTLTRRRLLFANVSTTRPIACAVVVVVVVADPLAFPAGRTNRCGGASLAGVAPAPGVRCSVVEAAGFFAEPARVAFCANSPSILRLMGLAGVAPAVDELTV